MKQFSIALAAAAFIGICGCTEEAQENYSEAGDDISDAAQNAGDKVSSEVDKASEKIKDKTE